MKINLYIFFSFSFILKTFSVIPVWDLDSQSINLLSSKSFYEYIIYNYSGVILMKNFTKNDNNITYKNLLIINKLNLKREVGFDDIESYYYNKLGSEILICPKGKFHPYDVMNDEYIIVNDYEEGWDLRCFYHQTDHFLIFYLNRNKSSLYFVTGNNRNIKQARFYYYYFDFKFPEYQNHGKNYEYKFPSIILSNNNISLIGICLFLNENENTINSNVINGRTSLMESKSISRGFIDNNYLLYFFTYNNISDFSSGYSNTYIDIRLSDYASSFPTIINNDSPFSFINNMEIKEIKFIENSSYAY